MCAVQIYAVTVENSLLLSWMVFVKESVCQLFKRRQY